MQKLNNFLDDFRKDHSRLIKSVASFNKAIESSSLNAAKQILNEINEALDAHFNFEETYLYPRLRRLMLEITQNLHREQETMREFINKTRSILDKTKLPKNELSPILEMTPRLSKLFNDCNDLVSLVKKFDKKDIDDLERRFRECRVVKNLVTV